jgi:hypothetical protein
MGLGVFDRRIHEFEARRRLPAPQRAGGQALLRLIRGFSIGGLIKIAAGFLIALGFFLAIIAATLLELGVSHNSTIVFPLPIDLLKPFADAVTASGNGAQGGDRAVPTGSRT